MKRTSAVWIFGILFCLASKMGNSQSAIPRVRTQTIEPFTLAISDTKTTNLIFPYSIKSIDKGSNQILVQKAKGVENILQLKADSCDFQETNLSLVTEDAKFYSFLLSYQPEPAWLNIQFLPDSSGKCQQALFTKPGSNILVYQQTTNAILGLKPFIRKKRSRHKIEMVLQGIFLKDNGLYFLLSAKNASLFDLAIDKIQFTVKDKKSAKRSAVYDQELLPIYRPDLSSLKGNSRKKVVVGFSPFTFFPSQVLHIKLTEKNGGRSVDLPVRLKTLLKARALKV